MRIIQFDGGAFPNPGTRDIGAILLDDNHVLKEIYRKLDDIGTNNEAEYSALREGLKQVLALGWTEMNEEAKVLLSKFQSAKVEWIPREKNARADAAASRALGFDEDPLHDYFRSAPMVLIEKHIFSLRTMLNGYSFTLRFCWNTTKLRTLLLISTAKVG